MAKQKTEATNAKQELEYSTYLDERKSLISTELDVSSRFDKSVLTLSGGTLLFSMTFVKGIAENPDLTCMLLLAWLLLALAICLMLVSLLTSQSALRCQRKILDASLGERHIADTSRNSLAVVTHWLNVSSIVAFIAALICLALFVAANLPGK